MTAFILVSFSKAAVYYETKWKVWLRWINCILINCIILYTYLYIKTILKYVFPSTWFTEPFDVAKTPHVSSSSRSVQNSNQKVTKNSLLNIRWNELKFCVYWEAEFLKDTVQRITLINQVWITEGSTSGGGEEYFMCNWAQEMVKNTNPSNKALFPNLFCMHTTHSLMQSYTLQLFNIFLQRFC